MGFEPERAAFEQSSAGRLRLDVLNVLPAGEAIGKPIQPGRVIVVTGWHADGLPFATTTAPFTGSSVERARSLAMDLAAAHRGSPPRPVALQPPRIAPPPMAPQLSQKPASNDAGKWDKSPPKRSSMGKFATVGSKMQALKTKFEARADKLVAAIDATDKTGEAVFEAHEKFLADQQNDLGEMDRALRTLSNGGPALSPLDDASHG